MKTIFLSLVILTFVACHKENILPDNIIYTDLQPDTLVSSIDTVYYLGYDDSGGVFSFVSLGSDGIYKIDLNGDNIYNLQFKHKFWTGEPFYNSPHYWGNYYENIKIEVFGINGTKIGGMNDNDFYEEYDPSTTPSNVIGDFNIGTNITDSNKWIDAGVIYISSDNWLSYFESKSPYIGVKLESEKQVFYGWVQIEIKTKELDLPLEDSDGVPINKTGSDWIKEIVIMGWAINQTSKNSIKAGQQK